MKELTFNVKFSRFLLNWLFLMIIWVAFTTSLSSQELLVGLVVTAIISLLSISMFTCCSPAILCPRRIFFMIWYLFVFIGALIMSNLDVARRVLTPSLPINPGIVKFKTKLTTNFSKMVLANSITLTPGTLTVDIIDDTLYIHWIDVKTTDPEKAFKEIAEQFEKILLKIF